MAFNDDGAYHRRVYVFLAALAKKPPKDFDLLP